MPHLQADKITSSAYEIWYMPVSTQKKLFAPQLDQLFVLVQSRCFIFPLGRGPHDRVNSSDAFSYEIGQKVSRNLHN